MGNDVPKFNQSKLKANLSMANQRLGLMRNKKINQNHALKEEIANFLRSGQEEMAQIKIEGYINNENFVGALELVGMFCLQCTERIRQISESRECPVDIRTAVETIIYAASRADCQELVQARAMFAGKYGRPFCEQANNNSQGLVNSIVVAKLETRVPDEEQKMIKLQEIAAEKGINYVPKQNIAMNIGAFTNMPYNAPPPPPPPQNYTPSYPPSNPSGYPPSNPPPYNQGSNPSGYPPSSNPPPYNPGSNPSGYPPSNPPPYNPGTNPSGYSQGYPPNDPGYPGNYPPNEFGNNSYPNPPPMGSTPDAYPRFSVHPEAPTLPHQPPTDYQTPQPPQGEYTPGPPQDPTENPANNYPSPPKLPPQDYPTPKPTQPELPPNPPAPKKDLDDISALEERFKNLK